MSDLQDLYQDIILDHNRNPRNFGEMDAATHEAEGFNPLCGDKITVYLQIENDVVEDVRFVAAGCAISKASASLMAEAIKGMAVEDAQKMFAAARRMFTGDETEDATDKDALGKIVALGGVSAFPMRVKCATLAWHTLIAALNGNNEMAITE